MKGIDDSINDVLSCVCEALAAAERPVCVCSTTIGQPVIATCCECRRGVSGELWARLVRAYRLGRNGGGLPDAVAQKPCAPSNWAAEFQITLARCYPTITDEGEIPDPEEQAEAARNLAADVATIQRAVSCCSVDGEVPYIQSLGVESDPSGGCSFIVATVQIPVSMTKSTNPYSE